ncbi:hypothetical protein CR513_48738, partial [Mucuna pruriens]
MLDPIPTLYTKLLPLLLKEKLLETVHIKPLEPPYPRSFDPSTRCDYHGRVIGHPTKKCWSLKHKDYGPNMKNNHLPAHRGVAINAIRRGNHKKLSQRGPAGREEKTKPDALRTQPVGRRKVPTKIG